MKKLVALVLTLVMSFTFLAACSNESSGGDANYLNDLKMTFTADIQSLNPFTLDSTSYYEWIANTMDGLIETDRYGRYVPCLAEGWEVSDDYTVWTFNIREGQYFVDHTGAKTEYAITAQSWVESMRYMADPLNDANNLSSTRGVISGLEDYYYALSDADDAGDADAREDVLSTFDEAVGVKAVDEYTLQYTLSGPTPFFLSFLLLENFVPIAPEFVAEQGEDFGTTKESLLYCGGYYISTWERDKLIVLTENEHYWDKENITLKTLNFEKVSDSVSKTEMFQRGEIHEVALTSEEVATVRGGDYGQYIYLSDKALGTFWFYYFFESPNPEFKAAAANENFRKAIYYALDRTTLSAVWEPNDPDFFVRTTLLPEGAMFDENGVDYTDYPALAPYKNSSQFDAAKAKEYMEKAVAELCEADGVTLSGVEPGKVDRLPIAEWDVDGKLPIDILYTSSNSENEMKKSLLVKEMLEQNLGKENINVILGYSNNSFSDEVWSLGNWDLVDDSFGFRYADPSANLNRITGEYDLNDCGYVIPEYDAMIAEAAATYDIEARYTKYSEAEAWMLEHAYYVPYLTAGGSYRMTHVVPYSYPQGEFGMAHYKYKGALVQETPVTAEQHASFKEAYEKEKAELSQN